MLLKNLRPDIFARRVADIDLLDLKRRGFTTLLFDLDNTLVSWRSKRLPEDVTEWLELAAKFDFKMCIVSNCFFRGRVKYFSQKLGIPAIPKARKPRKKSFIQAMEMLGSTVEETVVIGDQLFTDVLGGNRLGAFTIMVSPVDRREFFATLLQRTLEKILLFRLRRKGLLIEAEPIHELKKYKVSEGDL